MNVYEIDIRCILKHNSKFVHTPRRVELIHALNEERAKKKITLAKGKIQEVGTLILEVSSETIYAIRKTGTVTKQMCYVYSDGRNPRPIRQPSRE